MPRFLRPLFALLLASFTAFVAGCDGPCNALAKQICACSPNDAEENACVQAMLSIGDRMISEREELVCSERLESCTCEALEDGDLAACGLAKVP